MGIAEEMKKDEELRKAVEVLRAKGYGGRFVYIPRTDNRGSKREEVKKLLAKGLSAMEIAKRVGVSVAYVYSIMKK